MHESRQIGSAAGYGGSVAKCDERRKRKAPDGQATARHRWPSRITTRLSSLVPVFFLSGALVWSVGTSYAADASRQPTSAERTQYYVEDIKTAVTKHIQSVLDSQGIFHLRDEKTGEHLKLRFVAVHDPVRQIGDDVYFACTDFHVLGEPKKLYDVDFWMRDDTGELTVYQTKIHKEPRWSVIYGWYKQPRYTFVDDEIKYLY